MLVVWLCDDGVAQVTTVMVMMAIASKKFQCNLYVMQVTGEMQMTSVVCIR